MQTYKILGLLLSYPDAELKDNIGNMRRLLEKESVLPRRQLKALKPLFDRFKRNDLLDLQEVYVDTFDRGRSYSLHLFEHIHGESRDRGQAMVDLREHYEAHGVYFTNNELPDYLPLFLEFLSILDPTETRNMLNEAVHIIAMMSAKLKKRESDYTAVTKAIEALASVEIDQDKIDEAMKGFKVEQSLEELDEDWKEPETFDGANPANCVSCNADLERMVSNLENQIPSAKRTSS